MTSFKDRTGRRWNIDVTVNTIRRVRSATDINLLRVLDEPALLTELASDPITFVDALFACVSEQASEQGVSEQEFAEAFNGQAIEDATAAFLEAVVDFFPGARRGTLTKVLDRAKTMASRQEAKLQAALNDGTIDRAIDQAMEDGDNSGPSPAKPKSTPAT